MVDGATVLAGTGSEEYFNGGWYFVSGPYSSPFSALLSLDVNPTTQAGSATMLRWHVLNGAIGYRDSFSLSFEYGANRPAIVSEMAALSFYYAASGR